MEIKGMEEIQKGVYSVGSLDEAMEIKDTIKNNYAPNWDEEVTKEKLIESMNELLENWDI